MPIFVSRFSAERIASAALSRLRSARADRREEARETERPERENRAERAERERETGRNERAQDQLPGSTQTADSIRDRIRDRLRARRAGDDDGPEADDREETRRTRAATDTPRRELPTVATLPGVSTVRSTSRASAAATAPQVGRLDDDNDGRSPAVRATLDRFERLRSARPSSNGGTRTAELREAFRNIPSDTDSFAGLQARRLNQQVDATIRLQRANPSAEDRGRSEEVAAPQAIERRATASAAPEPEPSTALAAETVTAAAQPTARPTAEQISRANTAPEIQENLREDASEIQRGLRVDAEIESRQNLRETAENAQQTAESRRESRIDANERVERELSVQERQLEQELRATQRELREVNNETNRLQSASAGAPASAAANLANRPTLVT